MGGKGGSQLSPELQQNMISDSNAMTAIAQGQADNANTLFNLTEPGLQTAENFYQNLSSGDPTTMMQALAPATSQIAESTSGAIKNIQQTAPAGGEKNLAIEETLAKEGSQVGQTATNAYLGSKQALGQLAGQGIGESIQSASTGISGYSSASSSLGNLGNLQIQEQQLQAQQKGNVLGQLGGLAGDATKMATSDYAWSAML